MTDPETVLIASNRSAIPITVIAAANWPAARAKLAPGLRRWADANGFTAQPGRVLCLPDAAGEVTHVLAGAAAADDAFLLARSCRGLPEGVYTIEGDVPRPDLLALG